jgi:hypothetical protein
MAGLMALTSVACASSFRGLTRSEIVSPKPTRDDAFRAVKNALVDEGFELRLAEPGPGVITTEWKKFWEVSDVSKVNWYMRLTCKVFLADSRIKVSVKPEVGIENRTTRSVGVEGVLTWDPQRPEFFPETRKTAENGFKMESAAYMKTLRAIAAALGTDPANFQHSVTTFDR